MAPSPTQKEEVKVGNDERRPSSPQHVRAIETKNQKDFAAVPRDKQAMT